MTSTDDALAQQVRRATQRFGEVFGRPAVAAAAAPGRVNLIGEHTDYNDGFVLPMAISYHTVLVAAPGRSRTVRLASTRFDGVASFEAAAGLSRGEPGWSNYSRGVVAGFLRRGIDVPGFDAVIDSTVPLGGGLSSSAALEVATATLLEALIGQTLPPIDKALLAQQAEHEFAGVPCGIMDQFISTMAQPDAALLIDCRSHQTRTVPLTDPQVSVLIINTNVRHELSGGEYAQRRRQCESAARTLGVTALRDANLEQLETARTRLDDVTYRRARHVIGENRRTLDAAAAMAAGDWNAAGQRMFASHASLRDDFEVSCPELDLLVELAAGIGADGGVYGSRMTGGGFGGCTVSLVRTAAVERIRDDIAAAYRRRTGLDPAAFVSRPAGGAAVIALS